MIEIIRLTTADDVAQEAAKRAAQALATAQVKHEPTALVLAGGRLPPKAALLLAQKYSDAFDWSQVTFLIGDERCVPLDSPDSSWNAFASVFAAHPEIPASNQVRPHSNQHAEAAAANYQRLVESIPAFTQLWLGMGEDGHTLSLFPGHADATQETTDLVIPVHNSPKPPADRITFTYNALRKAQSALVFITGAGKAAIVKQIADGDHSLPIVVASQTIAQAGGHVTWLIDDEAAGILGTTEFTI